MAQKKHKLFSLLWKEGIFLINEKKKPNQSVVKISMYMMVLKYKLFTPKHRQG